MMALITAHRWEDVINFAGHGVTIKLENFLVSDLTRRIAYSTKHRTWEKAKSAGAFRAMRRLARNMRICKCQKQQESAMRKPLTRSLRWTMKSCSESLAATATTSNSNFGVLQNPLIGVNNGIGVTIQLENYHVSDLDAADCLFYEAPDMGEGQVG